MARLYSRRNATVIDDPGFGHFEADPETGGFDLPDELSDRMYTFHHRGKPAWETETERDERLHGEEASRRRDPQSSYAALERIAALGEQLARNSGDGPAGAEVAALRQQVEALTARLAAMDGQPGDGPPAKAPAAARTPTAAKATAKTAAK